jgi:hypothetical protein
VSRYREDMSDHEPSGLDRYPSPQEEPEERKRRWGQVIVFVLIGLVLVGVIVAHLTGAIGPGSHGGGNAPQTSVTTSESP